MATTPITVQKLKQVIEKAYEDGYHGCLDLKESYSDDALRALLSDFTEPTMNKNDGWKVFKIKELKELSIGTMFEHSIRGKGWIEGVHKMMRWHDGSSSQFYTDDTPWTEPMRIIGRTQKPEVKPKKRSIFTFDSLLAND